MASRALFRAIDAANRRRQRDLERQAKKEAQNRAAQSEVEIYENQLSALLSLHRNVGEVWDWKAIAVSLPPHIPRRTSYAELKAKQRLSVSAPTQTSGGLAGILDEARLQDEREFAEAMQAFSGQLREYEKLNQLSRQVLTGEHKAYTEVLKEFNPFAELAELGSSIHFIVHSATQIECALKVSGKEAIPAEIKTLTSTGKVSVKPMPKGRFHEYYQDHVCSCTLRVARELFALLPIDTVLVTATVDSIDSRTGLPSELAVLSVVIPRCGITHVDFDRVDASDLIETFKHRGSFKASRKNETFEPVKPFEASDILEGPVRNMDLDELLTKVQNMREEVNSRISRLSRTM